MNADLIARIRKCSNLPSLPTIAVQVLDLAQRPTMDIQEIARAISKDPALSTKILRTVNSSFYGRSHAISTISHALVVLGLQSVKTLVLTFSLVTNLSKTGGKGFKHLSYWKRSIYAATAAKTIAARVKLVQTEEAFLAALMADIGMLVLEAALSEQYGELCARAATHQDLLKLERQELDLTHADVAAILTEQWKFPPILAIPIAHSHNSQAVTETSVKALSQLVELAGLCAEVFVDQEAAGAIKMVREACSTRFKLSETDCDAMLADIGNNTKEVASLFEINIGAHSSYEDILHEANEQLANLSMQSQQQATQLQEQNLQLKQMAHTDGLTGLSNRASFDEFLQGRVDTVSQSGKSVALLMMDLDKFKSINDTHGHQAGDAVLKAVSAVLRQAARKQDMAARYGGEEMALVLPDTHRDTAAAIAETIRRAIGALTIRIEDKALTVTVSIGVATAENGGPLSKVTHLIKAADMAVYAAKHAGRNCVKVFALKAAA